MAYLGVGLSQSLAEEWVDQPQAIAPALAALMRSETWDRVKQKLHCYQAISRANVGSKERFILITIVETYLGLTPEEEDRFQAEMVTDVNKEVQDMVQTWDEAIAASKEEGREEATRQAIGLALKHSCGSAPDEVMEKLNAINDLSRLYEILEQAMKIRSIDELDL